jgi:hypothetical protein
MSKSHINESKSKIPPPKLRILPGGSKPAALRQAGVAPPADMTAGKYKITCEAARITQKWSKSICEFSFRVIEGRFFGVTLPGWIPIYMIGEYVHPGRYTEQCAIALGRDTQAGDDLSPEVIFTGKVFLADVRFRGTDGKQGRSPVDHTKRKDAADFLRVHALLSLESL